MFILHSLLKKVVFYNAYSKTVMLNRLRMSRDDNFVNTRLFNEDDFRKTA